MSQGPETSPESSRRWRSGFPVGAVILIAVGVVLLLQTTGVLPWGVWNNMWRFWPVLVIAFGINLIFGRHWPLLTGLLIAALLLVALGIAVLTIQTQEAVALAEAPLENLESVDVQLDFGAGELKLGSLPEGSPKLWEGKFQGRQASTSFSRSGNSGRLEISTEATRFLRDLAGAKWEVSLSRTPRVSLDIDGGAADIELDLSGLKVRDLSVDTGASSIVITMPAAAGRVNAEISAGAASVEIVIPEGVAARISSDAGLSSISINTSRFPRANGEHRSPDFDTAENRVDLSLNVGASSVSVR